MDGRQNGNDLGFEQPNIFTPSIGNAVNIPQSTISSIPDPENQKENSINRAFGGRSRADKIASQAAVHPSALRQNAPEFFQQSMQQQDIILNAAAEQKQKSKKGLLIGGIIGAVVLIVTIVIVSVVSLPQLKTTAPATVGDSFLDFAKLIMGDAQSLDDITNYDKVTELESVLIGGAYDGDYSENRDYLEKINSSFEQFKADYESLEDQEAIADVAEQIIQYGEFVKAVADYHKIPSDKIASKLLANGAEETKSEIEETYSKRKDNNIHTRSFYAAAYEEAIDYLDLYSRAMELGCPPLPESFDACLINMQPENLNQILNMQQEIIDAGLDREVEVLESSLMVW